MGNQQIAKKLEIVTEDFLTHEIFERLWKEVNSEEIEFLNPKQTMSLLESIAKELKIKFSKEEARNLIEPITTTGGCVEYNELKRFFGLTEKRKENSEEKTSSFP